MVLAGSSTYPTHRCSQRPHPTEPCQETQHTRSQFFMRKFQVFSPMALLQASRAFWSLDARKNKSLLLPRQTHLSASWHKRRLGALRMRGSVASEMPSCRALHCLDNFRSAAQLRWRPTPSVELGARSTPWGQGSGRRRSHSCASRLHYTYPLASKARLDAPSLRTTTPVQRMQLCAWPLGAPPKPRRAHASLPT